MAQQLKAEIILRHALSTQFKSPRPLVGRCDLHLPVSWD
jgi:hypothetical protein